MPLPVETNKCANSDTETNNPSVKCTQLTFDFNPTIKVNKPPKVVESQVLFSQPYSLGE